MEQPIKSISYEKLSELVGASAMLAYFPIGRIVVGVLAGKAEGFTINTLFLFFSLASTLLLCLCVYNLNKRIRNLENKVDD